jgi:hypothetical protein
MPAICEMASTYQLEFIQIFFVISAMVLGVFGPFVLTAPNLSVAEAWGVLGLAWLWLYGGNVVSTLWRFPRWIRRTLEKRG